MGETPLADQASLDVHRGVRITRVETIPLRIPSQVPLDGCSVKVPDAPGLGLTLDEDRIRKLRIDR